MRVSMQRNATMEPRVLVRSGLAVSVSLSWSADVQGFTGLAGGVEIGPSMRKEKKMQLPAMVSPRSSWRCGRSSLPVRLYISKA